VRLQTAERPGNGPKTASPCALAKLRRRIGLAAPHQHISKRIAQTFPNFSKFQFNKINGLRLDFLKFHGFLEVP
jgi:hypothetical protein